MGVPRKIVQIAAATTGENSGQFYTQLYALADDGTVWWQDPVTGSVWAPVSALPEAEACGARARDMEGECRLLKGHRDHHWSGSRRWG